MVELIMSKNCHDEIRFEVTNFSEPAKDIESLDITGAQLCYSGTKKAYAKLNSGKIKVVSFQIRVFSKIPVFTRDIGRGDTLTDSDVELVETEIKTQKMPEFPATLIGYQSRVLSKKGSPVLKSQLEKIKLIKRGSKITVKYEQYGISIYMEGIAKSDGGIDDSVSVVNELSKKMLLCKVTGPNEVSAGGVK